MRRFAFLGLFLLAGPALAAPPAAPAVGKVIEEFWEAAYLEGNKAGSVHTVTRALEQNGQRILRTTAELNLTVKRFNDTIQLRMLTGNDETPDGKVVGVSMRQYIGKDQALEMYGAVKGDQLHVLVDGANGRLKKVEPWNDDVVGLYRQQRLFRERKLKPGDSFIYQSFAPEATTVLRIHVRALDYEDVAAPEAGASSGCCGSRRCPRRSRACSSPA